MTDDKLRATLDSPLSPELLAVIQPVVDEWMDGDHGGTIYTAELTGLIVEALTIKNPVALYNAGYRAALAASAPDEGPLREAAHKLSWAVLNHLSGHTLEDLAHQLEAALASVPDEGPHGPDGHGPFAWEGCPECDPEFARPAAAPALDRETWIAGWMAGVRQMTTWPEQSIRVEAERQYARLSSKEPTDD